MKKTKNNENYTLISDDVLIRKCDMSFFKYAGFTMPKYLHTYFSVRDMNFSSRRDVLLQFEGNEYKGHFEREKNERGRIRLFWDASLKVILEKFNKNCVSFPSAKFVKINPKYYKLEIVDYVLVEDVLDEIQHEQNQNYDVTYNKVKDYTDEEIQTLYIARKQNKPKLRKASSKRYATDPRLKATRNKLSNYKCEINSNHKTFVSMSNENDYVECHHLIPMMAQDEFLSNENEFQSIYLDSLFNLISLCPICHTQFHYGSNEEVEKIFWKAYELRKEELLAEGFTKEKMEYILYKYYRHEFK